MARICAKCSRSLNGEEHYAYGYGFADYYCPGCCPNRHLMEGCDKPEEHSELVNALNQFRWHISYGGVDVLCGYENPYPWLGRIDTLANREGLPLCPDCVRIEKE